MAATVRFHPVRVMNSNIRFDYPRLFTDDEIPEYPPLPTKDEVPGSWSLRGSGGLLKIFYSM